MSPDPKVTLGGHSEALAPVCGRFHSVGRARPFLARFAGQRREDRRRRDRLRPLNPKRVVDNRGCAHPTTTSHSVIVQGPPAPQGRRVGLGFHSVTGSYIRNPYRSDVPPSLESSVRPLSLCPR